MVFCVIYVFATLFEFALLMLLQKQVFALKIKKLLASLPEEYANSRAESIYRKTGINIRAKSMRARKNKAAQSKVIDTAILSLESGIDLSSSATTIWEEGQIGNISFHNNENKQAHIPTMRDAKERKTSCGRCDKKKGRFDRLIMKMRRLQNYLIKA